MRKFILTLLGFILFFGILFSFYFYVKQDSEKLASKNDILYTFFIKTKEDADCILIQQGKANVLIDTADKQDAESVVAFLKERKVDSIQYVILTHPDKDHIGGMLSILENFTVEKVIQPYYPKENEMLNKIDEVLLEKKISVVYPTRTRTFYVGGMKLLIYPPLERNYIYDNNYSLVTLLSHNNVNMLFAGDAQRKRLNELLHIHWNKNINLLKIPHHGRQTDNSEEFIQLISPKYAVVTSNEVDAAIQDVCNAVDTKIYYTRKGTIIFESDGNHLIKGEVDGNYK